MQRHFYIFYIYTLIKKARSAIYGIVLLDCTQATSHQITQMRETDFSCGVGLQHPHKPSAQLAAFLKSHFGLGEDSELHSSITSRHSAAGTTSVEDVVVYWLQGQLCAGQVWAHVAVNGTPLALVQELRLLEEDAEAGTAHWSVTDDYAFIDTAEIVDSCIWCECDQGVVRTIVPRDAF